MDVYFNERNFCPIFQEIIVLKYFLKAAALEIENNVILLSFHKELKMILWIFFKLNFKYQLCMVYSFARRFLNNMFSYKEKRRLNA